MGLKVEIAREVCRRFPKSPTLTLAKKLAREQAAVYTSVEDARNSVRYVRGESGDGDRKKIKAHPIATDKTWIIPKSDYKPIRPYTLTATGRGVVISDLHIPYHDENAVKVMLDYAKATKQTDFCLINGDFVDCYSLSHWTRDPRARRFKAELAAARQMLDTIAATFKQVVYKFGNHEDRLSKYLMVKAPELLDLPGLALHRLLKLKKNGIVYVNQLRVIHAGHLNILHGHEYKYGMSNPVNPARGMFIRAHACTLSAHQHQTSQHVEPNIRGVLTSNWSLGCLCGLMPEYSPLNRWCHGFATLDFDGKNFVVNNRRIIDGQVV